MILKSIGIDWKVAKGERVHDPSAVRGKLSEKEGGREGGKEKGEGILKKGQQEEEAIFYLTKKEQKKRRRKGPRE